MGEKVTGYNGEVLAEVVDYHSSSGEYLGTAFAEERGCWKSLIFLPFLAVIYCVYQALLR